MKTPALWQRRGPLAYLLLPISFIYPLITHLRQRFTNPVRVAVPVLCVGGLTAGGAGKTPVALHTGNWCKQRGMNAYFLSRGYKGQVSGPVLVDVKAHSAFEVGDEPLLLAQTLPTIVAKDRVAGAQLAVELGASAIILDDGFQNPTLHKDVSLLVIGNTGLGNGLPIPAGPLREFKQHALRRADALVMLDNESSPQTDKPVIHCKTIVEEGASSFSGKQVFAFCGLAYPQKFYDMLRQVGTDIVQTRSFPDHHAYTRKDIENIINQSYRNGLTPITTAKDAVRLPEGLCKKVQVLNITIQPENPELLDNLLARALD